jgi:hypothetical protein
VGLDYLKIIVKTFEKNIEIGVTRPRFFKKPIISTRFAKT